MTVRFTQFPGPCGALLLILLGGPAIGQIIVPSPQIADELIKPVPQPTRDEFYAKLRDAQLKKTPRVVFVPGVLGSKIEECRTDGSQCTEIWGTAGTVISRKDDGLSIKSDRVYRTDIIDSVLFRKIYGDVLDHIRIRAMELIPDVRSDPPLTVFHYDWRQSNWDNAVGLAKAVCGVRAAAPDSPIIIIAHSMGGLMAKIWLKGHSDVACPNGKKPDVKRVVFVATPHLGSPKTIKAILQGYNYLFEETNALTQFAGRYATYYLMNALNQAGPSFPSIYELLPIRSSEYCTATKKMLSSTAIPATSNDGKAINIFDPETWKRHDFLNRIGGTTDSRNVYYAERIAPLLKRSEDRLCELADYDPSKATEVMYIVGKEKGTNTIGLNSLRLGTAEVFEKATNVEGDGTVPLYSARNTPVNSNSESVVVEANHLSIISHLEVTRRIDGWYEEAAVSAKREVASLGNAEFDTIMVAETVASGNLFPVSLNAREWGAPDSQLAIKINSRALKAAGYSTSDVIKFASVFSSMDSPKLYAVAASITDSPSDRAAWLSDVAKWAYVNSQYDIAIANSEIILGTKIDSQKTIPNFAELEKEATKLAGWSYLHRGDREKFNIVASTFAKKFSPAEFSDPAAAAMATASEPWWPGPVMTIGKNKLIRPMDKFWLDDPYIEKRAYVPTEQRLYRPN